MINHSLQFQPLRLLVRQRQKWQLIYAADHTFDDVAFVNHPPCALLY